MTTPSTARRAAMLGLAGAGLCLAALDTYVVVTLLPAMMAAVGLSIDRLEQATPIVTGFLCGYVIALPLLGAYSDVRGRIPVYLGCLFAFAVGSILTATAGVWNAAGLPWLVTARFLQGAGGGGLVPLTFALAADLYSGRARLVAIGSVAAIQEAGSVFGPLYGATLGAAAAGWGGWRVVFWVNVPLAALCAAALAASTRWRPATATSLATPPGRSGSIDGAGALLLGLGLGLIVLALYPDDPDHRATNALLVPAGLAGIGVLVAYVVRQLRRLEPLIPRELLRSRAFAGATAANLLIGGALIAALVDVPVLGRLVFGLDQLGSGLLLTQFLIGIPIGAILGGLVAGRLGARPTAAGGLVISTVAFLWMTGWSADELSLRVGFVRQADLALAACGLGFGVVIAPLTAAVLALTRDENHGLASGLVVLARTFGMAVGLSSLTAFGLYRFRQILGTPALTDPDLASRLNHLERLVAAAFLQEYREVFGIAAGMCALAAALVVVTLGPRRGSGEGAEASSH